MKMANKEILKSTDQGCRKQLFDWSGKVNMHDDVIDLWAWHCICNGIATPELARALAKTTGQATTAKIQLQVQPISLTSQVVKVLESIIRDYICSFLTNNELLINRQTTWIL